MGDEREANIEEREGMSEDFEAHGMLDAPSSDAPSLDRDSDEGDDVEGHMLGDAPSLDSPNAD